jgi:hypothetical protein
MADKRGMTTVQIGVEPGAKAFSIAAMKLEPLMTLRADLEPPIVIGGGPQGMRTIANVVGGSFEGLRLHGKILPGGGDWFLVDGESVGRLDVRLALETDDGVRIYVQYYGVGVINEKTKTAMETGGTTEFGDTYFMTQLRFETGDARYGWLNRVLAVAEGRLRTGGVEYRVFELTNG